MIHCCRTTFLGGVKFVGRFFRLLKAFVPIIVRFSTYEKKILAQTVQPVYNYESIGFMIGSMEARAVLKREKTVDLET